MEALKTWETLKMECYFSLPNHITIRLKVGFQKLEAWTVMICDGD